MKAELLTRERLFSRVVRLAAILPIIVRVAHCATLQTLCTFPAGPASPYAGVVQGNDGNFYGTTCYGGAHGDSSGGYGTVFRMTTNGTFTTLAAFANTNGANPYANLIQGSDGNFYGTTRNGGVNGVNYGGWGTVFRVTTNGILTLLYSFTNSYDGEYPESGLVQGSDGNLYGTTWTGSSNGYGTVFRMTTNGTLTTLAAFANTNGANPYANLIQGSDGNFYGTTVNGGTNGNGTIFQLATNGTLTTLVSFANTNGANPYASLIQGSDGNFYGTTANGGISGSGTVFQVSISGALTTLVSFANTNGANPYGGLVQSSDGNFYGTTESGGAYSNVQYYNNSWFYGYGTLFRVTTNGTLITLYSFGAVRQGSPVPIDGGNPYGPLLQGRDGNLYGTTYNGGGADSGTVFVITTNGTFNSLAAFALNPMGANPYATVVQGSDDNFYGTTVNGGTNGYIAGVGAFVSAGTVFKLTTNGMLTALASFAGQNGAHPYGGVVQGNDGNLYGTTENGGSNGYGTVFMVTTNGVLTSLYSFTGGSDGANPYCTLIQSSDGNFYGTTYGGGDGYGTVFMMTPNGALATLCSFAYTNGAYPKAGLIQGSDGNFYGTTSSGGTNDVGGTVFMVTTNGTLTTLISLIVISEPSFGCDVYPGGANPEGALVQGSDGNFYGTTQTGGITNDYCYSWGTIFRATTNGTLTTLHALGSTSGDGTQPYGGLLRAQDGNFYGTTYAGGPDNSGTIFQVTTNGTITNIVSFVNFNGDNPYAGLIQGSDGNLYGTTYNGGTNIGDNSLGYGTVFRTILPPTIFIQPTNQFVLPGGSASFAVGASGFGAISYQWRKNGANIAGATNTSIVFFNVTVSNAANYSVAVSNAGGAVVSSNATLIVECPDIAVGPITLPAATIGQPYDQTNTASGGLAPYKFAVTISYPPPGLVLSSNGVWSGTPSYRGNFTFTVGATDFYGCTGTNRYTLAVNCPTITLGSLPAATIGVAYNQTNLAIGGTAPYGFAVTGGTLPPGLALSSGGVLSGTATNAGNYTFTLTATDYHGCAGSQSYTLSVLNNIIFQILTLTATAGFTRS